MDEQLEQLKYPIGRFDYPQHYDAGLLATAIKEIEVLPRWLDLCIENLDEEQLHTSYRPGGWTINQVIHHLADSHMNAFIRAKLALTEDTPTIKPYNEQSWALLPDVQDTPVNLSITLLHSLHRRWAKLLSTLTEADWQRQYHHPEQNKNYSLWAMTALYAWHGKHHVAHIRGLRERNNW